MPGRLQASNPEGASDTFELKERGHPCGLARRLAAMFYDGLLLFALLMLATLVIVVLLRDAVHADNFFFQLYLLVVAWAYFAVCWRGGQSLGMKAWRIHIIGKTKPIGWTETAVRFLVSLLSWAAFGLGFLWSLCHPRRATWHDLASRTRLVVVQPSKQPGTSRKTAKAGAEKPG